MWTDKQIKGKILHKLTRQGKFEHSPTAFEHLQKGFPPEMRGLVKALSEELIKEGILYLKKTGYGKHVSLNLDKNDIIMDYIGEFLKVV